MCFYAGHMGNLTSHYWQLWVIFHYLVKVSWPFGTKEMGRQGVGSKPRSKADGLSG